jgi:peptidoglycan-associated lipoprotein
MSGRAGGMAGVVAVALLAACSHNPKPVAVAPQPAPAQPDSAALAAQMKARQDSIAAKARADSLAALASHADSVRAEVMRETADSAKNTMSTGLDAADAAIMAERVHFAFNRSDLSDADISALQQKLGILQAHAQLVVQVAGNCDERGSEEYNLALGERRAAAAKRWLTAHGVDASRVSIVSYGKERPLDPGHDEAAWARNRRDDFVVTRSAQ